MGQRSDGQGRRRASQRWPQVDSFSATTSVRNTSPTAVLAPEDGDAGRSSRDDFDLPAAPQTEPKSFETTFGAVGETVESEAKQLRAQLEDLRKENRRVRERAAARISKDALSSAKTIGELEAEIGRLNQALANANQELVALKNGSLAIDPLKRELEQVRAQLQAANGEINTLRNSHAETAVAPQPATSVANGEQNTNHESDGVGTLEAQLRQMQLRSQLDAAMLRKERDRLAGVEKELRDAHGIIASKDAKLALLSELSPAKGTEKFTPQGADKGGVPKSKRRKKSFWASK